MKLLNEQAAAASEKNNQKKKVEEISQAGGKGQQKINPTSTRSCPSLGETPVPGPKSWRRAAEQVNLACPLIKLAVTGYAATFLLPCIQSLCHCLRWPRRCKRRFYAA